MIICSSEMKYFLTDCPLLSVTESHINSFAVKTYSEITNYNMIMQKAEYSG